LRLSLSGRWLGSFSLNRPKIHEAGNKLRGSVREEVEKIVAVLKA
jgi:hypothetical protein